MSSTRRLNVRSPERSAEDGAMKWPMERMADVCDTGSGGRPARTQASCCRMLREPAKARPAGFEPPTCGLEALLPYFSQRLWRKWLANSTPSRTPTCDTKNVLRVCACLPPGQTEKRVFLVNSQTRNPQLQALRLALCSGRLFFLPVALLSSTCRPLHFLFFLSFLWLLLPLPTCSSLP